MKILCIDTTRKMARIGLFDNENDLKYVITMSDNIKHSEGLFLYIEKLLFECKVSLKEIDVFCGVVGPGSFTGIRVGMSVLKSFNMIYNKKLIPINTFEILATKYKRGCILLNSTATTCYYARLQNNNIIDVGVIEKDKLVDFLKDDKVIALKEEQDILSIEYNNIEFVDNISELYLDCVLKKIDSGETYDFLPYYLQLSQAERNVK